MIRLNVFLAVADDKAKEAVKKLGAELVAASRNDKGCIAYDMFESTTVPANLMICETWASEEDLAVHMAAPHFTSLVPQIEQYAPLKLEKFTF